MGVKIDISLENPSSTFRNSEVLTGTVFLSTSDQLVLKELKLTFRGECEVFWRDYQPHQHNRNRHENQAPYHPNQYPYRHQTEAESRRRHPNQIQPVQIFQYRNEETYLDSSISLPLPESLIKSDENLPDEFGIEFKAEVPFSFQLPSKLPSSCELKQGSVKYFVEASLTSQNSFLKLPYESDKSYKKPFYVIGDIDFSLVNEGLNPVEQEESKVFNSFSCGCKKGGNIILKLQLAKSGFVAGEEMNFHVSYENESSVPINKITTTFFQTISYVTKTKEKEEICNLWEDSEHKHVLPGNTEEWKKCLQIPSEILPTDIGGCKIIRIRYYLQVTGYASKGREISIKVPITIGTTIAQED
ncbi:unnamed protein product [Orchesella dallaii]|uniref:Arrestin C-terminal-like domain-containing protein n=1 Tax=Orchesella dallaii TaxID=48710 RepID=A0ABP1PJU0_9HEXA